MALAGLAKELYNVTAPLATFFPLFWEFIAPFPQLGEVNVWFTSLRPAHTRTQIHVPSSLLSFWSSQLGREMGANVIILPCFAWWEPDCAMAASPGLGHARTWNWQKGPGLSKAPGGKTQLLCGFLSTAPCLRLLTATVQDSSSCAHLAHPSGRETRQEHYAVSERGQRMIIQQPPELLTLFFSTLDI